MSKHSLAEAQANLPDLIDRAREGEEVEITDGDEVVARIGGVPKTTKPRRMTPEDIEQLFQNRVGTIMPAEDAGTFVSRMRDEDWER